MGDIPRAVGDFILLLEISFMHPHWDQCFVVRCRFAVARSGDGHEKQTKRARLSIGHANVTEPLGGKRRYGQNSLRRQGRAALASRRDACLRRQKASAQGQQPDRVVVGTSAVLAATVPRRRGLLKPLIC